MAFFAFDGYIDLFQTKKRLLLNTRTDECMPVRSDDRLAIGRTDANTIVIHHLHAWTTLCTVPLLENQKQLAAMTPYRNMMIVE